MVFSRRERIIAISLAASLGLLLADQYLMSPYLARRAALAADTEVATARLDHAQSVLSNRKRVQQAWNGLVAQGLKSDPAAAESQALHAMRDFAQRTGVDLQALKPDRAAHVGDFQQIRIQASGSGNTAAVANLLWQIESAQLPLTITEFRANSKKEGIDDLTFNLNVTTIVFSPMPQTKSQAKPASKGEQR